MVLSLSLYTMNVSVITALHAEAKPLIEKFGLKAEPNRLPIEVFRNREMALAISGIGKISSAMATTYLLGREQPFQGSIALNVGVCGSTTEGFALGQLLFIHQIVDQATGRAFYPDILMSHPCEEAALTTYDTPVTKMMVQEDTRGVVDMEASGFFQAASAFLSPHSIICLKVVSDFLDEGTQMDSSSVSDYIEHSLDAVEQILCEADCLGSSEGELLTADETVLLDALREQWRLTVAQDHLLRKWARSYKVRTSRSLQLLRPFLSVTVQTKRERNSRFDELREILLAQ